MQGLKISELKVGHTYQCLLSGHNVFVICLTAKEDNVDWGKHYNPLTGKYEQIDLFDFQLIKIKTQ